MSEDLDSNHPTFHFLSTKSFYFSFVLFSLKNIFSDKKTHFFLEYDRYTFQKNVYHEIKIIGLRTKERFLPIFRYKNYYLNDTLAQLNSFRGFAILGGLQDIQM